jgi:hypothetical protein
MGYRIIAAAAGLGMAACAAAALAQPPATAPAAPAAQPSIVVANPTYVSIPMEIVVNKPVKDVWDKVGKYCDLGTWLRIDCTITKGKDGEFGAVRSIAGGRVTEVLVGKTEYSYTYVQPVAAGRPYNLYHGTLEARPINANSTRLIYTLTYDNSMLPDDAARTRDLAQRRTQFEGALANMKTLVETGAMPPAPARAGTPPAATPATPPRP